MEINYVAGIVGYLYFALIIQRIAVKTQTPNSYFAWIPLANLFLLVQIAKKPISWFWLIATPIIVFFASLLLLIPFRTIVTVRFILAGLNLIGTIGMLGALILVVVIWYEIIKRLRWPGWTIVILFLPLINTIFLGFLAFTESSSYFKNSISNNESVFRTKDQSKHKKLFE